MEKRFSIRMNNLNTNKINFTNDDKIKINKFIDFCININDNNKIKQSIEYYIKNNIKPIYNLLDLPPVFMSSIYVKDILNTICYSEYGIKIAYEFDYIMNNLVDIIYDEINDDQQILYFIIICDKLLKVLNKDEIDILNKYIEEEDIINIMTMYLNVYIVNNSDMNMKRKIKRKPKCIIQ